MPDERSPTIIDYDVAPCPKCAKTHHFKLKGLGRQPIEQKVPLFGGSGVGAGKSEIMFTCPDTNKKFTWAVPEPTGVEIMGVASEADLALVTAGPPAPAPGKGEFDEWSKKSRDVALDFSKTMLSASTGGIAVYFAVLKYIGFEKIGTTAIAKLSVLPPVFFLLAAILYVLALRPRHELVAPSEFSAFRQRRLEQLNRFIIAGTTVFLSGLGLAIAMLFSALTRK
jgi:hypothetical protein